MGLGVDRVEDLEIIADTYRDAFGACEEAVVITFTAPDTIAATVESDGGDDYEVDVGDICSVVAGGFFDPEGSEVKASLLVGEYVEVKAVDTREEEMLAGVPAVDEFEGRELVGEGVVEQDLVGEHKLGQLLEAAEDGVGSATTVIVVEKSFVIADGASDFVFFHRLKNGRFIRQLRALHRE